MTGAGGCAQAVGAPEEGTAVLKKTEEAKASGAGGAKRGWSRSVKTYSWSDGPHPDQADSHVHLYITIPEASELTKEHVDVAFGPARVEVRVNLPENRTWFFRREGLYAPIDPQASSWFLSKNKHRICVKLAKVEPKKKWHGLTTVFAMVEDRRKDALDFGLAAITGSTSHVRRNPLTKESQNIVSGGKREYWSGPPKYEWNEHDRQYHN
uniref:CS domain-containing protein n=1 Tax=Chloropicon laureae TaxID=464258 RepID=A0A7S3DYL8_9CHLO|mmetsp:Transcript_10371/g.26614  ORF Transcript_10371/g.26614 Transcript_10371/m.26614 type:complete len:210 (+) Transcript_10371:56-685(+)|eukprot:CAMPEP_0197489006 /NCGR_PEP_ID=MMETSP1311-20131121/3891_1 /TAXON_ID=464262 /ORGANISM="Genus nov. species nov., Strain RCC856" /LENGTH=209 /DNA_ID=CAMNT_0043033233 /DNA_START=51 /DNA_END=680 /DNA_ORIENTATION=-